MNKHIDSNYDLEELVLRVFLKHVKSRKLYVAFRLSVNHTNCMRDIFHVVSLKMIPNSYIDGSEKLNRVGSSFTSADSYSTLLHMMRDCCGGHKLNVTNDGKFQIAIMQMVNSLIHNCIEYKVLANGNLQCLEELGGSIFKEVCHKLFGDSFEDKTEEAIDPNQREFLRKMAEMGGAQNPMHIDRNFIRMVHDQMRQRQNEEPRRNNETWRNIPSAPYFLDDDDDDDFEWL